MKTSRRNFNSFLFSASLFSIYPNLLKSSSYGGKYLILIELQGANDGLNTVIPYSNPFYYKLRPNIAIKKEDILTIEKDTGLHFSLEGLAKLFEEGELKIIQNLGYPQPVLSHFRSIELWETGGDGTSKGRDGWLIQSLNHISKKSKFDAKAIHLDTSPGVFKGGFDGYLGPNSIDYNPTELESRDSTIPSLGNTNIGLLGDLINQRKENQENIISMKNKLRNKKKHFNIGRGTLGSQLTQVVTLLDAGVKIPVFKVSMGSFDTHIDQFWKHRDLLRELSDSIYDLVKSLKKIGVWKDTLIMTYSEFGRRANENGSRGTDHGMAAPHFLLGGSIRGGIYGGSLDFSNLNNNNLAFQVDYRSLYNHILSTHFNLFDNPFAKFKSDLIV